VTFLLLVVIARARRADADRRVRSRTSATARLSERLAADSTDDRALHRVALLEAWDGRHDASLRLFDQLLALGPNLEAEVDRARVIAWKGQPAEAVRVLDELLERSPGYIPALEARAEFLAWAGEHDRAVSSSNRGDPPGSRSVRVRARLLLGSASAIDH
jgi:tetratricopeptide (TPR) repeat protein